jgi:hypothetical protein
MIFGSKVCGGQVADCRVETSISSLGNSGERISTRAAIISYGSYFQDCKVEDGKICQGSKFLACQLERCEDEGSEHASAPLSFRNVPAEIREHIMKSAFEQIFHNDEYYSKDERSFTALIEALRGSPLFYHSLHHIGTRWLVHFGKAEKLSITFRNPDEVGQDDTAPDVVSKVNLRLGLEGATFFENGTNAPLTWNTEARA